MKFLHLLVQCLFNQYSATKLIIEFHEIEVIKNYPILCFQK